MKKKDLENLYIRIPRVKGIDIETNNEVRGYLHILERYDKYYILPSLVILKDKDYIPIYEVYKDSVVIDDTINLSSPIKVEEGNHTSLKFAKDNIISKRN